MEENVQAYWSRFEAETGEKVVAKSMGQKFSSPSDRGDWGLLVATERGLRFRATPGENWFASLFRAKPASLEREPKEDLIIPYSSIRTYTKGRKKFFDRLFGSPFYEFTVEWNDGGSLARARFAVDPERGLKEELERRLGAPRA